MTFRHAGDLGDILYSLPTIRALGGGALLLHSEKWTREAMTDAKVLSLRHLLTGQFYIDDVRWLGREDDVDVNLNDFRAAYFRDFGKPGFPKRQNLCEWILKTHGCEPAEQHKQWLQVKPHRVAPVIINRTGAGRGAHHVYRNRNFPWSEIVQRYAGQAKFVGTLIEYQDFLLRCDPTDSVEYHPTKTLRELAEVIAGADLFIGNQSCAYAIAEGLKKPAILEVCPWLPNCLFQRSDVIHGWDADIDLPTL